MSDLAEMRRRTWLYTRQRTMKDGTKLTEYVDATPTILALLDVAMQAKWAMDCDGQDTVSRLGSMMERLGHVRHALARLEAGDE